MITAIDHIVLLVRDIEAAIRVYESLLGCAVAWRTRGDGIDTALFTLANVSLELMAPASNGTGGERVRAALDRDGEGLASLCFRVADVASMHRRLSRLGLEPEPVAEHESRNLLDRAALSWRRTRASSEKTHGVRLFFLERADERPRSIPSTNSPVLGLDHIVVATRHPERAAALYGARLRLDMALDRTNPDWGARLMFFRCGDLVVEVVHRLSGPGEDEPDRLWGLSWRVGDADATRSRLEAAGLDVSGVREGRKPGTRVFTIRGETCGVPTLALQQAAPRSGVTTEGKAR